MREHFSKDPVVTEEQVRDSEKVINNHSRMWGRIFNIGKGSSGRKRCLRALIANFVTIPVMQGLRKDHKADIDNDPNLGPKLRPLCAANRAPNAALGSIVAKTVKAIADSIAVKTGG